MILENFRDYNFPRGKKHDEWRTVISVALGGSQKGLNPSQPDNLIQKKMCQKPTQQKYTKIFLPSSVIVGRVICPNQVACKGVWGPPTLQGDMSHPGKIIFQTFCMDGFC